jgi:hypothetical protein
MKLTSLSAAPGWWQDGRAEAPPRAPQGRRERRTGSQLIRGVGRTWGGVMERLGLVAVCVLTASQAVGADCTTLVLRFDGKGTPPEYVQTNPMTLTEVARASGGLRRVGLVGGHLVYEASRSVLARRLVWDRGDWSFCTALLAGGDESIIVGIHRARVLRSGTTDIVHVRIQDEGTGHFQESVFFAVVGGALVHVRQAAGNTERIAQFFADHKLRPYHRGLGFCEDSLTQELLAESEEADAKAALCIGCRVVVRYKLEGAELVADKIELGDGRRDCDMFPKW